MSDSSPAQKPAAAATNAALPNVSIAKPTVKTDMVTILGLVFAIGLIGAAIAMGGTDANFFNLPSILIVILGTMAATAVSYTGEELGRTGKILGKSALRKVQHPGKLASALMDFAVIARKKGVLTLSHFEKELQKDPFLSHAMQLVVDGYQHDYIETVLTNEIESLVERHKRASSITRRASEVAPAMGLIGTLVGLVQMLANLESPETIGPSMAVALLTTFYGAILGTIIMAPLAVKLEKNSADEALIKSLIRDAAVSIAKQENPRQLEMRFNSELPPAERIQYFK